MKSFFEDEVYIKMCEKAEEIQKLGKPQTPYLGKYIKKDVIEIDKKGDYWLCKNIYGKSPQWDVWLPRQDQLQGMIKGDFIETCDYISHYTERFVELKTPEKILLKIIMEENYHKTWNGEEWVSPK